MIETIGADTNTEGDKDNLAPTTGRLDLALDCLEHVWRKSHVALHARLSEKEQSAEQLVQTLRVQSSHWKAEAERLSTKLDRQNQFQQKAQKAEQELTYQRQSAQQWQERAQSWKEEARRSEEARVAALHKANNNQVKEMAQELDECLGEAIVQLKQTLTAKTPAPSPAPAPEPAPEGDDEIRGTG